MTKLWECICKKQWDEKVKLFTHHANLRTDIERLKLSSGTKLAGISECTVYAEGALIPVEPWRKPYPAETDSLWCSNSSFIPYSTIGIITLKNTEIEILRSLISVTKEVNTKIQSSKCFQSQELDTLEQILTNSGVVSTSQGLSLCYGATMHPPNLQTVTRTPDYFVGLHIDSWDGRSLHERQISSNRVSINIGKEDRFFLFINITLAGMAKILNIELDPGNSIIPDKVATQFMMKNPDYPVIGVRIRPGEAYIAPTENIIHDATTFGTTSIDCVVNIRGFFGVET